MPVRPVTEKLYLYCETKFGHPCFVLTLVRKAVPVFGVKQSASLHL
jgi:hypothetical protein